MERAEELVRKDPELAAKVKAGEVRGSVACRTAKRQEAVGKILAEPEPLPAGPFRVIVADPPWAYEKRMDDGTHRAALTYPPMTTAEICAMPVGEMAAEDSILWLWTTNAFMRDAFAVLDAWGFKEKTILTWVKNKMGRGLATWQNRTLYSSGARETGYRRIDSIDRFFG
jgi:hypothetical protein